MARRATIECCGVCSRPIKQYDSADNSYAHGRGLCRMEALKIEVGFSRGGWGHFNMENNAIKFAFQEEVCGECFDQVQALLKPLDEFLRGGRKRQEHHVSAVRDNVVEPERRGASLLRALSFVRPR